MKQWESMEGVKETPPSLTDPIISLLLATSRDPQESVAAAVFLQSCSRVVWSSLISTSGQFSDRHKDHEYWTACVPTSWSKGGLVVSGYGVPRDANFICMTI